MSDVHAGGKKHEEHRRGESVDHRTDTPLKVAEKKTAKRDEGDTPTLVRFGRVFFEIPSDLNEIRLGRVERDARQEPSDHGVRVARAVVTDELAEVEAAWEPDFRSSWKVEGFGKHPDDGMKIPRRGENPRVGGESAQPEPVTYQSRGGASESVFLSRESPSEHGRDPEGHEVGARDLGRLDALGDIPIEGIEAEPLHRSSETEALEGPTPIDIGLDLER